jgi:OCT family organic cation transporter-like MFS transporter 4/5
VLSQIGKFGVTCAFAIIYVFAAELFPTVLRTTGMGMCSVMARVGSILAPIVGRELVTLFKKNLKHLFFSNTHNDNAY